MLRIGIVTLVTAITLMACTASVEPAGELCGLFEAGYLQPHDMDSVLRARQSLFSSRTMSFIQRKKAELGGLTEAYRQSCYTLPENRQTDCLAQNAAALMVMWLESLERAANGTAWYDTAYGRWDIDMARAWGTAGRPRGQMERICSAALGSQVS